MYARIWFLVLFENLVFFVPFLDTLGTSNPGSPDWRRGVSQNYRKTSQNRRHQGNALPGPQKRQKMFIFQVRISEGIRNVGTKKRVFLFLGYTPQVLLVDCVYFRAWSEIRAP